MLNPILIPELAKSLQGEFSGRAAGHCVRVDHLSREDGLTLARLLREAPGFEAFVLGFAPQNELEIRPDQAVEIRNRKDTGICLIVPDEFGQDAASSLANSFALFDLHSFLSGVRDRTFRNLPPSVQPHVRAVLSHLRGRAAVSVEDTVAFYLEIARDPAPANVGRCLWMVGLVPDPAEDFAVRLGRNHTAVDAISRPPRPQALAEERLRPLGLTSVDFERSLARYLSSRSLHQPEEWQRPIATDASLSALFFGGWPFPDTVGAQLSEIRVEPFVDKHGNVQAFCKLKQEGAGMALEGEIGPKSKVVVRWSADPATPSGVEKWRADLVPSKAEYGEDVSTVLGSASIKAGRRQVSMSLDVDLEETEYRAVQVRICALDAIGAELVDQEGMIVYGHSEEFWLGQPEELPPDERIRKRTDISVPLARLRFAIEAPNGTATIDESSAQFSDNPKEEARYFSLQLDSRTVVRVAVSRTLAHIHDKCLENPRTTCFRAVVESDQLMKADDVQPDPLPGEFIRGPWEEWLRQRNALMTELRRRGVRSRVEALEVDASIRDRARKYARSYRELLDDVRGRQATDELRWALRVDTLQLEIQYAGGQRQRATIVLPTHPLRFLWYISYAELLEHYSTQILRTPKRERAARMEVAAVEKLGPVNLPMFVPDDGSLHVFTHNLGLFAGVLLPTDVREPARMLSDLATVLGMVNDFGPGHDFPIEKLAREMQEYCTLHGYSTALRVSVSNPGDGGVISAALQKLYEGMRNGWMDDATVPHLDILAHCSTPLPIDLPVLDRLRERLYVTSSRTGSHLNPLVQIAIRDLSQMDSPTGGDVNLAVLFDHRPPQTAAARPIKGQDSASAYGLLHRVATEFTSTPDLATWTHQIVYDPDAPHEKHPVTGSHTNELIETHARMLRGASLLIDGANPGHQASLSLALDSHARDALDRIHRTADWVILMDRFLGIDLFDDPVDPYLSAVSRKYLLDYAPEFIDGLGHRLVVTTMWREEVEDILARAMHELGFAAIEESVGDALQQLKSISGRLALRLIRDNSQAKEAASLGVVVAWLKARNELTNSILVPVDAHPEIFAAGSSDGTDSGVLNRCDLIQIQFSSSRRIDATFMEVKSRQNQANYTGLADRMCDQMESTENQFRALFFQPEKRLDHVLQRSKLAGILRFYALRARRYGFISDAESLHEILKSIDSLEAGFPHLRTSRSGFVVDLAGRKQKPFSHRGATIKVLTASEFSEAHLLRTADDVAATAESDEADRTPATEQPATTPAATSTQIVSAPEVVSVALGSDASEKEVAWRAGVKGSPHLFILGIPGQGKSWLTTRLLLEMDKQQLPALVLDFHGQFSNPESLYMEHAQPVVWDATAGLPFSPFEATSQADVWKTNCFAIAEIFQYVFDLGDIQRGVVYDAMRDCYIESGIESESPAGPPRLAELERKIRQYETNAGAKNTLIRCKPIFEFNLFDEERAASAPIDLLSASRRGLVVDLHKVSMETTQIAAGAFVLRKLYKDMFSWGETDRLRLALVLDEAHRICRDTTLPKIMKEGRKFGVAVIAASQQLDDFHPDVIGNCGTKVVFRTNHPASRKVSGFLRMQRGVNVVDIVEQLQVGTALVQTPDMREADLVRIYPMDRSATA